MTDDENMGFALGASDYITKPVDWTKLSGILEKYKIDWTSQILVIEDDQSMRKLTRKMLEKEGWAVSEAENGEVGIAKIRDHEPGLILLDLMMPKMDGFEFINEIQKNPDWIKIPVVVVTSKDLSVEEKNQLQGNVEMVLQKGSFERRDLIKKVNDILETQQA